MTNHLRLTAATSEQRLGAGDGFMICPRCGDTMHPPFTALSRIHPKTRICPDCGGAEGLLQTAGQDASWTPVTLAWAQQLREHQQEIERLNSDIDHLCREADRVKQDCTTFQQTNSQLRVENRKFSARHEKNKEVIHQLTEQVKFAQQQIKDLLANVLHTEDT